MSHSKEKYLNCLCLFFLLLLIEGLCKSNQNSATRIDISKDYFWGISPLRTERLTCSDEALRVICNEKCGTLHDCVDGTCYCITQKRQPIRIIEGSWDDIEKILENYAHEKNIQSFKDFEDNSMEQESLSKKEEISSEERNEAHALRHQIAHFCPDLDVARKCIRTCMKVGKPAFCGKDHVCYCGHRYSAHDKNKQKNFAYDEYEKFRDLYEKYFGPQRNKTK